MLGNAAVVEVPVVNGYERPENVHSGSWGGDAPVDAHCPPPPQCDPTDDILVAPLEPGIADVGLFLLSHAPPGIKPARLAEPGTLDGSEGAPTIIVGYGTTTPTIAWTLVASRAGSTTPCGSELAIDDSVAIGL